MSPSALVPLPIGIFPIVVWSNPPTEDFDFTKVAGIVRSWRSDSGAQVCWFSSGRRALQFVLGIMRVHPGSHGSIHVDEVEDELSHLGALDIAQALAEQVQTGQIQSDSNIYGEWIASLVAVELMRPHLQEGATFEGYATLHLGSESRPHRLYRLVLGDQVRPRAPNLAPAGAGWFIGRVAEMQELSEAIDASRLVTITGAPGVGKTSLAKRFQLEAEEIFEGRVVWLNARGISDPSRILAMLAEGLDVTASNGKGLREAVITALGDVPYALFLDHADACSELATVLLEIIERCPQVQIIVCRQRRMRLPLEVLVEVQGMPTPAPGEPLAAAADYDAIRLFLDRAQSVDRQFRLTEANLSSVISICVFFDGLPLGIEAATSKMHLLSPHQVLARLRDMPEAILTPDDPLERSVGRAILASIEMLSERSKVLFRRLSVFQGPFSADLIADALCDEVTLPKHAVLEALEPLIESHLVEHWPSSMRDRYFVFSEAVRVFSKSMLTGAERKQVEEAHRRTVREWCDHSVNLLATDDAQAEERFLTMFEDIHATLLRACSKASSVDWPAQFLLRSYGFWFKHNRYKEFRDLASLTLQTLRGAPTTTFVRLINGASYASLRLGELETSKNLAKFAFKEAVKLGDAATLSTVLNTSSGLANEYKRPRTALRLQRHSAALMLQSGDQARACQLLYTLAGNEADVGNFSRALEAIATADTLRHVARSIGKWAFFTCLLNRAHVFRLVGDYDEAWASLHDAIDLLEGVPEFHYLFRWIHHATTLSLDTKQPFGPALAGMAVAFFDQFDLPDSPSRAEEIEVWRFVSAAHKFEGNLSIEEWVEELRTIIRTN